MAPYTLDLDDIGASEPAMTGGKGAGLARLIAEGFPVPSGFVVTTAAYEDFVARLQSPGTTPEERHERIMATALPDELAEAVLTSYRTLGAPTVAVRSSGTAEDLAGASFAGQHDTHLDVTGEARVLTAVRDCWASLWNPRASAYRDHNGWGEDGLAIAVVIQHMVDADWAGVMLTADPVSGRRDRIVIEAVRGLGEALVSGEASGYRHVVDKTTGRPTRDDSPLPPGSLEELVRLGTAAERVFGGPQDIEWTVAGGRCFLVQARPLTAAATDPTRQPSTAHGAPDDAVRTRMAQNLAERMPYPPYPMDTDLVLRPVVGGVLGTLRSTGLTNAAVGDVLTGGVDDVPRLSPPPIRFTPRTLARLPRVLPRIVAAVRARPESWSRQADETLGALVRRTESEDLTALADDALLGRMDELLRTTADLVPSRFGAAVPRMLLPNAALRTLLRLMAGPERGARLHIELMTDIPSVTTSANRELRRLAAVIRETPELAAAYREEPASAVAERLRGSAAGRALLDDVAAYLHEYRHRELSSPSVGVPALGESPEVVHGLLASMTAGRPAGPDAGGRSRFEQARDELRSAGRTRALTPLALRLAAASRGGAGFREDSHYVLYMLFPALRLLASELGARLAARGVLPEPDDVYYLTVDEVRTLDADGARERVARRRTARDAVLESYSMVTTHPAATAGEHAVSGLPASAGTATGRVRIVRDASEFSRVSPGDVLVCPFTNPAWTPLFSVAGAVVVDGGGATSHAAIVAREYGIPAVMGTGNGTSVLTDGDRVVVDGDNGTVTVVAAATAPRATTATAPTSVASAESVT